MPSRNYGKLHFLGFLCGGCAVRVTCTFLVAKSLGFYLNAPQASKDLLIEAVDEEVPAELGVVQLCKEKWFWTAKIQILSELSTPCLAVWIFSLTIDEIQIKLYFFPLPAASSEAHPVFLALLVFFGVGKFTLS